MDRLCAADGSGVAYFEFAWSWYFIDATFKTPSLWPTAESFSAFYDAYINLPPSNDVGNVDPSSWQAAADLITPLCRANMVAEYKIPQSLYPGTGGLLPGAVVGWVQLDDDPDCTAPPCVLPPVGGSAARRRFL
jgi:hypothetical protein